MKENILVEQTLCGFCGEESCQKCLGCGKDVCYGCRDKNGKEFRHAIHFRGSNDVWYCQECLGSEKIISTPLFKAYRDIADLRNESNDWWKDFDSRTKIAEEKLNNLLRKEDKC